MLYRKDKMEHDLLEGVIINNDKLIYSIISKYQNYLKTKTN